MKRYYISDSGFNRVHYSGSWGRAVATATDVAKKTGNVVRISWEDANLGPMQERCVFNGSDIVPYYGKESF